MPTRLEFARTLREAMTDAERALWYQLRAKRLFGWKFRRQQQIGNYIVDFVCLEAKLVVELAVVSTRSKWMRMRAARRGWNRRIFECCGSGTMRF